MKKRKIKLTVLILTFVAVIPLFSFSVFSCDCCVGAYDFNGDGVVNSNDAVYLVRNSFNADKYPISVDGDINGDGYENSDDAIYVLRHTLAPQKYPVNSNDSYLTEITEFRTTVQERTNRPQEFERGSSYSELIFYKEDSVTNREKLEALPHGTVIIDESIVLGNVKKLNTQYGNASVVDVNDSSLPFTQAIRVNVTSVPSTTYGYQLSCGNAALLGKATAGDALLIKTYVRCPNRGDIGKIELIIEQDGSSGTYEKIIKQTVVVSDEWIEVYAPAIFVNGYTSLNIRFGFKLQTVEIGGFEIVNFGGGIPVENMPITMDTDCFQQGAAWRDEAFERIDEVRKGDIKVVVTDKNGKPMSNAKTEIEMYEHEFQCGTALFGGQQTNATRMNNISSLFNSAVLGNELKWTKYEENQERPKIMIDALNNYGINYVRGHCLVWDRTRKNGDTSVPVDLPGLYKDREAMTERIRSHIEEIMTDMDGYIKEWDVLNEACNNTVMQDIYGRELIKEWFDMARATGVDADLYYNDFTMTDTLFSLLDEMEEMGVDYDGIGVQSHYNSAKDMNEIYEFYNRLTEYGKKLKVTEYDFATTNEKLQAEFTRDLMILTFSFEEFEGFYLWGINGGDGERYVCYDSNWNPRLALEQIQDLIYNKWMTKDEGRTDNNGVAEFNGFYGSYKISVIANGVKKTVLVDCHKGNDNTIYIEMP